MEEVGREIGGENRPLQRFAERSSCHHRVRQGPSSTTLHPTDVVGSKRREGVGGAGECARIQRCHFEPAVQVAEAFEREPGCDRCRLEDTNQTGRQMRMYAHLGAG